MDEQKSVSVQQEQKIEVYPIAKKEAVWGSMGDKHIAYIGFILLMAGLAALGGAIETGGSILSAVAMIMDGTAFLLICKEEGKSGERESNSDAVVSLSDFVKCFDTEIGAD